MEGSPTWSVFEEKLRGALKESMREKITQFLRELPVWVLTYDHKHGTDISLYMSEDSAYASAAQIMSEYLTDFGTPEECLEFLKLLEEKKYSEAASQWGPFTGDTEFFSVYQGALTPEDVGHPELEELKRDLEDQVGAADDGA